MSAKYQVSVRDHKDYQAEVERLEFTKEYIRTVLDISKGNKEFFVKNMKQSFADLNYKDSSTSYTDLLANASFLELAESELKRLESVIGKPYFSRIDFTSNSTKKEEILYIGKVSLFDRLTQQPIIVQGAAGSGKTTIALHRISYVLYSFGFRFPPEKLMILAPNRLFIDYISAVLPELGVNKINQTTFIDFMRSCLGQKIKLFSPNSNLIKLLEDNGTNKSIQWVSSYKGSLEFKELIHRYVKELEYNLAPHEDFSLKNLCL